MKQSLKLVVAVIAALNAMAVPSWAQIPAFPGASGPGSTASGGRGATADVYHVTNLEFDLNGVIPGSLKYGINTAPAAGRTIVFDVGGTIFQNGGGANAWFRSSKSKITIAGQTAPGPGITIAGVGTKFTGDNVILRNITIRPNKDPSNPTNFTYDAISTQLTNSIIDHVSATWFTDEGISSTDAGFNTSVQYSLIGEGLNYNGHSYGSIISTEVDGAKLSFHNNFYTHLNSRVPRLGSEMDPLSQTGAITNWANNVIYNYQGSQSGYSGINQPSSTNFLNNYYVRGYNGGQGAFDGADDAAESHPDVTKIYENGGNKGDTNRNGVIDGAVFNKTTTSPTKYFAGKQTFMTTAFSIPNSGALLTADQALAHFVEYGGANWSNRNPIDDRIIQGVTDGSGQIILDLTPAIQAAEWATVLSQQASGGVAPFSRGAGFDTDNDGMPNYWETAHGFSTTVANNNGDDDGDGYSNLEEYLNDSGAFPAPKPVVFNGGTAAYSRIQNWDLIGETVNVAGSNVTTTQKWQPSRFDTAVTHNGLLQVNKVGQHAGKIEVAQDPADTSTLEISAGWLRVDDEIELGLSGGAATLDLQQTGQLHVHRISKGNAATFSFTGGVLNADIVEFGFTNAGGTISPGKSVFDLQNGTIDFGGVDDMQVQGDLEITSGLMKFDIAGANVGQYDFVDVDGQLTAGGGLEVVLDGYDPVDGDVFNLLDFDTFGGGSFALTLPPLDPTLAWDTSDLLTTGELLVVLDTVEPDNADFNGDDMVDGLDFLAWQIGFGATGQTDNSNGDANHDGSVDGDDLAVWETQFGSPPPLLANFGTVPEPSTAALMAVLAAAFCSSARRRAKASMRG